MSEHELVDYTVQGFILPIVRDGVKGYASINAEMYSDSDGLDVSGTYHVYMLHPRRGSTQFTLEPENSYDGWKKVGGALWIEGDVLQEIIKALTDWRTSDKNL